MKWRYDLHKNYIFIQDTVTSLFSGAEEFAQVPLSKFLNLAIESDRALLQGFFSQAETAVTPQKMLFRSTTNANDEKRYSLESMPVFDHRNVIVGLSGDLKAIPSTDTKTDSTELLNILEQAKSLTGIGSWEARVSENTLIWSAETCKMFGISPSKGIGTISNFLSLVLPDDRIELNRKLEQTAAINEYLEVEYQARRFDDNQVRWFLERGKVTESHGGKAQKRVGIVLDITERKHWELISQLENDVFNSLLQHADSGFNILETITRELEQIFFDFVPGILLLHKDSASISKVYSPSLNDKQIALVQQLKVADLLKASTLKGDADAFSNIKHTDSALVTAYLTNQDSEWQYQHCLCFPVNGKGNDLVAFLCLFTTNGRQLFLSELELIRRIIRTTALVIDKENSARALRTSEERFKGIFNDSAIGILITEPSGHILEFNNTFLQLLGYQAEEMKNRTIQSLTHPEDWSQNKQIIDELTHGIKDSVIITKRYLTKSNDVIYARVSVTVQKDSAGIPVHFIGICEDITEQFKAEKKRQEVQTLVTHLFSNLPGIVYRCLADADRTMLFMNDRVEQITGYSTKMLVNNYSKSFSELIHTDDRESVISTIGAAVLNQKSYQIEYRIYHYDGSIRWVWEQGSVFQDSSNSSSQMLDGYISDITNQKETENKIKESQRRFDLLLKASNEAIWDWDLTQNTLWRSKGFESLFGYDIQEMRTSGDKWKSFIHPDDYEFLISSIDEFLLSQENKWSCSYRYKKKDGTYVDVFDKAYLIRDESGNATRMVGGMSDVTEKLHLEERLRRSQRLESIGQLTGGVAHDFNNLLTVILGNAEMVIEQSTDDEEISEMAEMIVSSAKRGAELTQSLLSFARKQSLKPQKVSIAELVTEIYPLLARTTGELTLETDIRSDTWPAKVDPGQLENALLNLVINSRDACGSKGAIHISSANVMLNSSFADNRDVNDGDYVCIRVRDNGKGVSEDNLQWVFEPFFTTKPKGKGTGLGLAMVYGFVKQSGGQVEIFSHEGTGTTVEIYLPRFIGDIKKHESKELTSRGMGGKESILLVEDDELVRSFTARELTRSGYMVLQAENATQALALVDEHLPDLVFTDVLLPGGMNGIELVDKIRDKSAEVKVILSTGFTENSLWETYNLQDSVKLTKPYSINTMLRLVRHTLDDEK